MSDSEDDIPILELIKKRKRNASQVAIKKEKPSSSSSSSSSRGNGSSSSSRNGAQSRNSDNGRARASSSSYGGVNNKSTQFYENTAKGMLVQRLLVRWWYAIKWPKVEDLEEPPAGYEPLDGFPGVYISTRVDSLGKLLDLRDMAKCPNLRNLSRLDSSKLKELCIRAYEAQMAELKSVEGEDCRLVGVLKAELAEVKHVNTSAADQEARKYVFS